MGNMKYSLTRKICLSNIDRVFFEGESEEITITEADSFDEASQKMEILIAERNGYYKAKAQQLNSNKQTLSTAAVIPPEVIPPSKVEPVYESPAEFND